MTKILHLIDAASPTSSPTSLALLADSQLGHEAIDSRCLLIGPAAFGRWAQMAGVQHFQTIGVPYGNALLGLGGIAHRLGKIGPVDLIHCWSVGSLWLAHLCCAHTAKVLSLTDVPGKKSLSRLSLLIRRRPSWPLAIICSYQAVADELLSCGLPARMIRVIEPTINVGRLGQVQRLDIRKAWQINSQTDTVVAVLSDRPAGANAMLGAMACAMVAQALPASTTGPQRLRLLLHPRQHHAMRARRLLDGLGNGDMILQDARVATPWSILPACDGVIVQRPGTSGLSSAWAMAARVPVIAGLGTVPHAWATHQHTALLAKVDTHAEFAHLLQRLLCQPRLALELSRSAKQTITTRMTPDRYTQALGETYQQTVKGPRGRGTKSLESSLTPGPLGPSAPSSGKT